MARSNTRSREDVVGVIVALLVSEKPSFNIPLAKLDTNYRSEEGERIPYKELGYPTLVDFLRTIPSIQLHNRDGMHLINFLGTDKTRHVSELVAKQRTSTKPLRHRSTCRRSIPSNYYSRVSRNAVSLTRINPCVPSMTSLILEMIQNEPKGLAKNAIIYRIRDKKPGIFFDLHVLNEILESLRNKVVIRDNVVYAGYVNGEKSNDVPWVTSKEFNEESKKIQKPLHNFALDKDEEEEDLGDDFEDFDYVSSVEKTNNDNKMVNGENEKENDVEMIINERLRFRLEKLIQNRPKGIFCAELPKIFMEEYKMPLEWEELGFNSLSDFVLNLPEVFRCIQPNPAGDFQLFHAKSQENSVNQMKPTLASVYKIYKDPEDDVPAVPPTIPPHIVNNLIPDDVVPMGESIGQISVTCFNQDDKGYEEVVVCDAFSPSFFWIQLRRKQLKLGDMMDTLESFYSKYESKYTVPLIILEKGLNVACQFYGKWHRGIVKAVEPDRDSTTTILYYDYGTLHKHPASEVRFLHRQFSQLPAQAIPCGLYNIKPLDRSVIRTPEGRVKAVWPIQTSRTFVQRVHDKPLVAMCGKMHHENNSLLISLTDTSSEEDVNIGDWLVDNGLAIHGIMVRIRGRNFQYKHYLDSLNISKISQKTPKNSIVNLISKENLAPNEVSKSSKTKIMSKLESLKAKILGKNLHSSEKKKCPSCGFIFDDKSSSEPKSSEVSVKKIDVPLAEEKVKVTDNYDLTKPKAESSSESRKGSSSDSERNSTLSLISDEAPDAEESHKSQDSSIAKEPALSVIFSEVTNEEIDVISEFETIVKPKMSELKSGTVDWTEACAAGKGLLKTPTRPISPAKPTQFQILKSIKKRKREIVDADDNFTKIVDKSLENYSKEPFSLIKSENVVKTSGIIPPMVRQVLKNIRTDYEISRVSVSVDEFDIEKSSIMENSSGSDWNGGANNIVESLPVHDISPVKSQKSDGSVSTVIDLSASRGDSIFNSTKIHDSDTEIDKKILIEELSSEDSMKIDEIPGIYTGFLKNSLKRLKEIIYSSNTEDSIELDSDDSVCEGDCGHFDDSFDFSDGFVDEKSTDTVEKEANIDDPSQGIGIDDKSVKIICPKDLPHEIPVFNDVDCQSDDEEFDICSDPKYWIETGCYERIKKFLLKDDNNNNDNDNDDDDDDDDDDDQLNSEEKKLLPKIHESENSEKSLIFKENKGSWEAASDYGVEDIPRSESDEIHDDDDDVEEVERSLDESENSFLSGSILEEDLIVDPSDLSLYEESHEWENESEVDRNMINPPPGFSSHSDDNVQLIQNLLNQLKESKTFETRLFDRNLQISSVLNALDDLINGIIDTRMLDVEMLKAMKEDVEKDRKTIFSNYSAVGGCSYRVIRLNENTTEFHQTTEIEKRMSSESSDDLTFLMNSSHKTPEITDETESYHSHSPTLQLDESESIFSVGHLSDTNPFKYDIYSSPEILRIPPPIPPRTRGHPVRIQEVNNNEQIPNFSEKPKRPPRSLQKVQNSQEKGKPMGEKGQVLPDCLQVELFKCTMFVFFIDNQGWITLDQFRIGFTNFPDTLLIRKVLLEQKYEEKFKIVGKKENPQLFELIDVKTQEFSGRKGNKFYLIPVGRIMLKMLKALKIVSLEDIRLLKKKQSAIDNPVLKDFSTLLLTYLKCREIN